MLNNTSLPMDELVSAANTWLKWLFRNVYAWIAFVLFTVLISVLFPPSILLIGYILFTIVLIVFWIFWLISTIKFLIAVSSYKNNIKDSTLFNDTTVVWLLLLFHVIFQFIFPAVSLVLAIVTYFKFKSFLKNTGSIDKIKISHREIFFLKKK